MNLDFTELLEMKEKKLKSIEERENEYYKSKINDIRKNNEKEVIYLF